MLISLFFLRLPLLSPPIFSRANSKLICNSQWQSNWCLIFELGNRIMRQWEMEGRKKRQRGRKRETSFYNDFFWGDYYVSMWEVVIHHNVHSRVGPPDICGGHISQDWDWVCLVFIITYFFSFTFFNHRSVLVLNTSILHYFFYSVCCTSNYMVMFQIRSVLNRLWLSKG